MPLDAVGFLNQKGPTFTQLEGNFKRKVPLQKPEVQKEPPCGKTRRQGRRDAGA